MISYEVFRTKHNGKEGADFKLTRPNGTDDFLFLHFKTPVMFTLSGEEKLVSAGTCILLSPKIPHAFYPLDAELIHDWIHFYPSDVDAFMKLGICTNEFFTVNDTSFITVSLKKCELELVYKEEFYKEMISSEVSRMFVRLKRQLGTNITGQHADAFKTLRIDMYRYPEKYTSTVEMADSVCLSRSRFSNLYMEFFGVSPQKDHINAKISKAKHLLSIDTISLQEISESCGYTNIYHFMRQFREITGTTPGKYRSTF